jgi:hypothetical protein
MTVSPMNRLAAHVFFGWILVTAAFTILVLLVIPIVEFPALLLIAIVARMFGDPEFPNRIQDFIYSVMYRPDVLGAIFLMIGFFVLRAMLLRAIGKEFGGKVLVLQDAPVLPPQ